LVRDRDLLSQGIFLPSPIVLVLDFLGRGKRTDCQRRSKIENENEDDWGGKLYRNHIRFRGAPVRRLPDRHSVRISHGVVRNAG